MKALSTEKQKILPNKSYFVHKAGRYIDVMPDITYSRHKKTF